MNAPYNGYPVQIEYFAKEDGSVALVHCIQIQDEDKAIWSEVYVDAHSGDVVSSTNFVAKASVCTNIPSNIACQTPTDFDFSTVLLTLGTRAFQVVSPLSTILMISLRLPTPGTTAEAVSEPIPGKSFKTFSEAHTAYLFTAEGIT